ncbi:hypothetical protein [uncultured Gammaproteobacteria bacterium]|nr:hypothetical protein [uncultured Gammaproteobacteria bacterium]
MSNTVIEEAKEYSEEKLLKITHLLENLSLGKGFCIVVLGSFARKEASESSDFDYFILTENGAFSSNEECQKIKKIIQEEVEKSCGDTGTFEQCIKINELTTNLGGVKDTNQKLTRRILFLLEGYCLYGKDNFTNFRKQLLKEYIKETVFKHKLSRFLLNDIIRFYRTMATDFEYKISEEGKEANIRNIKLIFSRKLLYFSGIIVIAETIQKNRADKIIRTLALLEKPPLERIEYIFGDKAVEVLALYDYFLEEISTADKRKDIELKDDKFRELKDKSKEFSRELLSMLKERYGDDHPIHCALIF